MWKAEIVAVYVGRKVFFDFEVWDAQLRVYYREKRLENVTILGGRDMPEDVSREITGLELTASNIIVHTRGTFTPVLIDHKLPAHK
jgi:hypothetical protein